MIRFSLVAALCTTMIAAPVVARAPSAATARWARSWSAASQEAPAAKGPVADLTDRTVRQIVRISVGGDRVRLRLSNAMSRDPLLLDGVHVALAGTDGAIVPGSDHVVTFGGGATARLAPGAPLLSDAVRFTVPPLARLAVSFHVPQAVPTLTVHPLGRATGYVAAGNRSADTTLTGAERIQQRLFLEGVEVEGSATPAVIVAVGDSITDGARATVDGDARWPDVLAARLQKAGFRTVGVANAGISGNRILDDGTGPALLARLDRDVLSVPGARAMILLEGINDIGSAARDKRPLPTAATMIAAMRQVIDRAHDRGIKVYGATILPYKGAGYYSEEGDRIRQAVNQWIMTGDAFDGAFDFDKATHDPADPLRLAKDKDGGDALHPSDAGYRAMGEAVDLAVVTKGLR